MCDLCDLHDSRQHMGSRRQPRHINDLKSVDRILSKIGETHPYQLTADQMGEFKKERWFAGSSSGLAAIISNGKYLYRLAPVIKLATYASEWFATPSIKLDAWRFIRKLQADLELKRDWLEYSAYAKGTFASPRNISFWTTFEFGAKDIVKGANNVGLPSNWIIRQMVILRLDISKLSRGNRVFVPTVLDAFNSEIFHPTKDIESPPSGSAIHLNSGFLSQGADEFVLGPLPVELVDLWPVVLEETEIELQGVRSDSSLWKLLHSYYSNL